MYKLFIVSMVIVIGFSNVQNYQQRALYLGQQDNICLYGEQSDQIMVVANLDGAETITFQAWGKTGCTEWYLRYAKQITPMEQWVFANENWNNYFTFYDQTIKTYRRGELYYLVQNTTMVNPTLIAGIKYDCTILGDGKIQHFGIQFPNYPPATFNLKCAKITQDPKNLQS